MRAAANTAIANHLNLAADLGEDFFQLIKWRARAIQLPSAMIGNHNRIGTHIDGAARISGTHHALQAKCTAPSGAQIGRIIPIHILIEHGRKIITDRNGNIRTFADMVFQLRQFEF